MQFLRKSYNGNSKLHQTQMWNARNNKIKLTKCKSPVNTGFLFELIHLFFEFPTVPKLLTISDKPFTIIIPTINYPSFPGNCYLCLATQAIRLFRELDNTSLLCFLIWKQEVKQSKPLHFEGYQKYTGDLFSI